MDGLLLNGLYLQCVQLLVEYLYMWVWSLGGANGRDQADLTQVHDNALVNLLPQVSPEYLDQRNLQGWNLAVHEDTSQIQLHLKADINLEGEGIHTRVSPYNNGAVH